MRLAHPFMPFISEEIWQNIRGRKANDSICIAPFPEAGESDLPLLNDFETLFELVSGIRNIRNAKNLSPKTALPLAIRTDSKARYQNLSELIIKLAHIDSITFVDGESDGTSFRVNSDEFFINLADEIDVETERENLQKELAYTQGFLDSVIKKLSNERFVQNAKGDIVEKERQKQADAEAKIATLKEALVRLG
jgi:valyl-tRNA synthetase